MHAPLQPENFCLADPDDDDDLSRVFLIDMGACGQAATGSSAPAARAWNADGFSWQGAGASPSAAPALEPDDGG